MEGTADHEEAGGSSRRGIILPLKKRALNDRRPVSADSLPEPEVKQEEEEEEHGSVYDGGESSVPSSAAATPPLEEPAEHDPLSAAAVTEVFEKLGKFLEKQKWKVLPEASPALPPPPPVAEKLMGDAIRSSWTARERSKRAPRPPVEKKLMCDAIRSSAASAEGTTEEGRFGEAVQRRLAELRATRPFLLYKKTLEMSDVINNQNRLLMSCKGGQGRRACAITRCLLRAETKRVENKAVGLVVPSMDQEGVSNSLTLKFLESNKGYRFISKGWREFKKRNNLVLNADKRWTRDVELEVWAYRSRELRRQPPLDEEGKLLPVKDPGTGKEIKDGGLALELDHHFHEDGGLGVILLHREHQHTKKRVKREEDDKDKPGPSSSSRPVARVKLSKTKQEQDTQRDDAVASAAVVAQRAKALATAADAMSKEEMDAEFGEAMSNAAIGLLMIAGVIPKKEETEEERQEDVKPEQGHDGQPPSRL